MAVTQVYLRTPYDENGRIDLGKLGKALRYCYDLPFLQNSDLTQLACVVRRAREQRRGLELARGLQRELIACAEQITQRTRYPIEEIVSAIEEERLGSGSQHVAAIQKSLGMPFPRDRIDLARYYAIRLVMEGLKNETVADFLKVDLRTVGNYIAEAKERIRLTLETR